MPFVVPKLPYSASKMPVTSSKLPFRLMLMGALCALQYYTPAILELAGLRDNRTALLVAMLPAAINSAGTLVGMWQIDKCGRRQAVIIIIAIIIAIIAVIIITVFVIMVLIVIVIVTIMCFVSI